MNEASTDRMVEFARDIARASGYTLGDEVVPALRQWLQLVSGAMPEPEIPEQVELLMDALMRRAPAGARWHPPPAKRHLLGTERVAVPALLAVAGVVGHEVERLLSPQVRAALRPDSEISVPAVVAVGVAEVALGVVGVVQPPFGDRGTGDAGPEHVGPAQECCEREVAAVGPAHAADAARLGDLHTLLFSVTALNSGEIDVRTIDQPLGTGERYSVNDLALSTVGGRASLQTLPVPPDRLWEPLAEQRVRDATMYNYQDPGETKKRTLEEDLRGRGLPYTIVAPVSFMENLWSSHMLSMGPAGTFESSTVMSSAEGVARARGTSVTRGGAVPTAGRGSASGRRMTHSSRVRRSPWRRARLAAASLSKPNNAGAARKAIASR